MPTSGSSLGRFLILFFSNTVRGPLPKFACTLFCLPSFSFRRFYMPSSRWLRSLVLRISFFRHFLMIVVPPEDQLLTFFFPDRVFSPPISPPFHRGGGRRRPSFCPPSVHPLERRPSIPQLSIPAIDPSSSGMPPYTMAQGFLYSPFRRGKLRSSTNTLPPPDRFLFSDRLLGSFSLPDGRLPFLCISVTQVPFPLSISPCAEGLEKVVFFNFSSPRCCPAKILLSVCES